jgi:ariadne-1
VFIEESHDKPQMKAYEVEFKALSDPDIRQEQANQASEVSTILGLPAEQCAILLRHFKWQKERLIEHYMDMPEKVLEDAGLGQHFDRQPALEKVWGFTCDICCDNERDLDSYAMKCGHRYCASCYRQYFESKIKDEGEAARIQCPRDGCARIVDGKSIRLLVSSSILNRRVWIFESGCTDSDV